MVHKGRIHKEIRYFRNIFWNFYHDELVIEIRENGGFRKITQKRIHGIKNHSIWISYRGEIKERSGMIFLKIRRT